MKNPTLLTLLKQGCTVTFPSGYSLTGDRAGAYIDERTEFGADGLRNLCRKGLQEALNDEKKYRKQQEKG